MRTCCCAVNWWRRKAARVPSSNASAVARAIIMLLSRRCRQCLWLRCQAMEMSKFCQRLNLLLHYCGVMCTPQAVDTYMPVCATTHFVTSSLRCVRC